MAASTTRRQGRTPGPSSIEGTAAHDEQALRDVWRHSEAAKVDVSMEFDEGKTRVMVRDR
jgi:hypothetical protein